MTKDNSHTSHRERLRNRFVRQGLTDFEPHQILELVLFYAIPRKDTNPIAHRLLKRFGTLADVFNAPITELVKIEGIGENAAVFLKMQHDLLLKYEESFHQPRLSLSSHKASVKFVEDRLRYLNHEEFHVVCLDCSLKLIKHLPMFKGSINSASVNLRELTSAILQIDTSAVIVAHNHPTGVAMPSQEDLELTEVLMTSLKYQDIELLDHIIVAGSSHYSFYSDGMILKLRHKINQKIPKLFVAQNTGDFDDE